MKIYRIAKERYLDDLSGEGARLYGGRWNKKGMSVIYFSESLSLAVLEILVHLDFKFINNDFGYIEAEIPDELVAPRVKTMTLDINWRRNPPPISTQDYGNNWLKKQKNLAIRVPSAILPFSNNILVNPSHPKISELKIVGKGKLDVDSRVFK